MSEIPPDVARRASAIRQWSEPADVIDAIVSATEAYDLTVWVGASEHGWRWSPATKGGPYPLLRMVARYLNLDHRQLLVGAIASGDGWTIADGDGPADHELVVSVPEGAPNAVEHLLEPLRRSP